MDLNTETDMTGDNSKIIMEHKSDGVLMQCPAEVVLKLLSGKWKPQIMQLASRGTIRFNRLLKQIPGSSKQSLSVALRELEEARVLSKNIISKKPLHIEYSLTDHGRAMIPIYSMAGTIARPRL
jgi:DNA-binding HxlR family transcriptional regulator